MLHCRMWCADLCSVNNGGCPSDAVCKVWHSLMFSCCLKSPPVWLTIYLALQRLYKFPQPDTTIIQSSMMNGTLVVVGWIVRFSAVKSGWLYTSVQSLSLHTKYNIWSLVLGTADLPRLSWLSWQGAATWQINRCPVILLRNTHGY